MHQGVSNLQVQLFKQRHFVLLSPFFAFYRSECPRLRSGSMIFLTRCFISFGSGKWPSRFLSHKISSSSVIIYLPATSDGMSFTAYKSSVNVVNSSCAIHAARKSHPHLGQYSMLMVGFISMQTLACRQVIKKAVKDLPHGFRMLT